MAQGPDLDLFGSGPKLKRPKTPTPTTSGAVQRLIMAYKAGYERQFGEPPVVFKSDGAFLKGLVTQFGEARVAARLAAFLKWDDAYIRSTGYAIHVFHRQWNRLAAHVTPMTTTTTRVPDAARTEAYRKGLQS